VPVRDPGTNESSFQSTNAPLGDDPGQPSVAFEQSGGADASLPWKFPGLSLTTEAPVKSVHWTRPPIVRPTLTKPSVSPTGKKPEGSCPTILIVLRGLMSTEAARPIVPLEIPFLLTFQAFAARASFTRVFFQQSSRDASVGGFDWPLMAGSFE